MRAFRICPQAFGGSRADAFSGRGSLHGDGRWHHRGRLAVYAAQHLSLATLEILVHLDRTTEIQPFVWYEIDVPDREIVVPADLPAGWDADPESSRTYGDRWLNERRGVALRVPSAVIPSEYNLLLNPAHPKFSLSWVHRGPEPVVFDRRLIRKK